MTGGIKGRGVCCCHDGWVGLVGSRGMEDVEEGDFE